MCSILVCKRESVSVGSMMMVKSRNGDEDGSFDGSDPTTLMEMDHADILQY